MATFADQVREMPDSEIKSISERFRSGVDVRDRRYLFKKYEQCFVGREAVDWLIKNDLAKTRSDAVILGSRIMDGEILYIDSLFHLLQHFHFCVC